MLIYSLSKILLGIMQFHAFGFIKHKKMKEIGKDRS